MEKLCGIYKITSNINNKVYIGQSTNIYSRWKHHIYLLKENKHNNNHLQNCWNKYGEKAFEFKIIELCERKNLNKREIYWANENKDNLLNIAECGTQDYIFTKESKKKMSNSKKNKVVRQTTKLKISQKNKGRKLTNETKRRMSVAKKNHPVSLETRKKISQTHKGQHYSKETEFKSKKVIVDDKLVFESLNECGRYLNTNSANIHRAIKKGYKCKGHIIKYM